MSVCSSSHWLGLVCETLAASTRPRQARGLLSVSFTFDFWRWQQGGDFSKSICLSISVVFRHGLDQTLFLDFFFFRHQPIFHLVSPSLPSEGTNKPNLMPADCSNLEMVETLGVVWGGTNWDPSFNFQVWFTSNRTLLFLPFSLNCECRSPLFPVYQFGGGESVSPQLSILFSAFSHSLHTQHTQAHTHSTH